MQQEERNFFTNRGIYDKIIISYGSDSLNYNSHSPFEESIE